MLSMVMAALGQPTRVHKTPAPNKGRGRAVEAEGVIPHQFSTQNPLTEEVHQLSTDLISSHAPVTSYSGDCVWGQEPNETFREVLDVSSKWTMKVKDSEQHHASPAGGREWPWRLANKWRLVQISSSYIMTQAWGKTVKEDCCPSHQVSDPLS